MAAPFPLNVHVMGNLVWLASFPKSGNTWMRAFLHNLFCNRKRSFDVNRMVGEIFQSDGALMWYQMLDRRPLVEWSAEDLAGMRPRVDELIAQAQNGTLFCKTHNALMMVHGHPTINLAVTSGAIYIVRNPLDFALSFADYLGCSADEAIDFMATHNLETPHDPAVNNVGLMLGSWSQHVESWTGRANPRLHTVRYEDMLRPPFANLRGNGAVPRSEAVAAETDAGDQEFFVQGPEEAGGRAGLQGEVALPKRSSSAGVRPGIGGRS